MKYLILLSILAASQALNGQQAHMTTGPGQWDDPATWDSRTVPGPEDFAVVKHSVEATGTVRFGAGGLLYVDPGGLLCVADSLVLTCGSRFENHGTVVTPVLRVRDGANTGRLLLSCEPAARGCNYGFEMGGEVSLTMDFCQRPLAASAGANPPAHE